jgi:hypothetical protein
MIRTKFDSMGWNWEKKLIKKNHAKQKKKQLKKLELNSK